MDKEIIKKRRQQMVDALGRLGDERSKLLAELDKVERSIQQHEGAVSFADIVLRDAESAGPNISAMPAPEAVPGEAPKVVKPRPMASNAPIQSNTNQ